MINIPPIKSPTTPKAELLPDITRTWKVGQVLSATSTQAGPANSNVLLQLGNQVLTTRTPVPLEAGQEVKLLVQSLGNTTSKELPLLKLVFAESPQAISQTATHKLREFIAVQQSLSQLQQTASTVLDTRPALPRPVQQSLQQLQQIAFTQAKDLDAAKLKTLVSNSGVFLESKLASSTRAAPENLVNDVKLQLLKISQQLSQPQIQALISSGEKPLQQPLAQQVQQLQNLVTQTAQPDISKLATHIVSLLPVSVSSQLIQLLASPTGSIALSVSEELKLLSQTLVQQLSQAPARQNLQNLVEILRSRVALIELGQQVDQSISKITSLQLQPLSREADSLVMLLFNLVFKDSHEHFDINVRFQQESQNEDKEQESWQAVLSFQFKTLGHVQVHIHLLNDRVSTVFHSELSETASKIRQLLPLLETGLRNAGLDVISLDVKQHLIDEPLMIKPQSHILDENV